MVVECDLLGSIFGAAATVGTGIIALWIYNNWGKQKGSEVVSFEAKETIKDLMELISQLEVLSAHLNHDSFQKHQEIFQSCRDLSHKIFKTILFIDSCIKIDEFPKVLDDWNQINRDNMSYFYDCVYKNKKEFFDLEKQEQLVMEHAQISYILIKKLQPYALYQTKFSFKKTS